jgi:hypothetical protein
VSAIDRLPEHLKNRKTAEAVTAPSALLLAGAGTSVAILAGAAFPIALGVGALAWAVRVALGLPRKPKGPRIELARLTDPWQGYVRDAMQAQSRYGRAVASADAGPLRDRLGEIGARIDAGVFECYRVAQRGAALSGAIYNLDVDTARQELATATSAPGEADDTRRRTIEALQAQVDSGERVIRVEQDAKSRLGLLNARLDEAVARAVELSLRGDDVTQIGGLGSDVDQLVGEMESLRVALDEVSGAGAGSTGGGATATGTA